VLAPGPRLPASTLDLRSVVCSLDIISIRTQITDHTTEDRPPGRGGFRDRYDDRGSGRRYDDRRGGGGGGYRDRYDDRDRGYGGGRRDDYGPRIDRYASRDDRYGGERRGGGYGGGSYDRAPRGPPPERSGYGGGEPAGGAGAPPTRDFDDRRRYD